MTSKGIWEYSPTRAMRLKEIQKKWSEWCSGDVALHKPLPHWRDIVQDIEFLSSIDLVEDAYHQGHKDAQADYENGFADGYDEAMLKRDL